MSQLDAHRHSCDQPSVQSGIKHWRDLLVRTAPGMDLALREVIARALANPAMSDQLLVLSDALREFVGSLGQAQLLTPSIGIIGRTQLIKVADLIAGETALRTRRSSTGHALDCAIAEGTASPPLREGATLTLYIDGHERSSISAYDTQTLSGVLSWRVRSLSEPYAGGIYRSFHTAFYVAGKIADAADRYLTTDRADAELRRLQQSGTTTLGLMSSERVQRNPDLADRLARFLAEVVDTALITPRDVMNNCDVPLTVGSFKPQLGERAAALLEEAGL